MTEVTNPLDKDGVILMCPFCGGGAQLVEYRPHKHAITWMPDHHGYWAVECLACDCGLTRDTKEAAITVWNRRSAPAVVTEEALGLRRIVEEIDGGLRHGTWRDDHGMRLKDTPEWVAFYNALSVRAEPVAVKPADNAFADALPDEQVRIWINACNHEPARQALRQLLAYRIRGVAAPLVKAPAPAGPKAIWLDMESAPIREADVLVPCWGNRGKLPTALRPTLDEVSSMLRGNDKPVMTFGLTGGGDPKHPLMLGYDTKLQVLRHDR